MAQKINYIEAAKEVSEYLKKELPEFFANSTKNDKELKKLLTNILKEAKNLLGSFKALEMLEKKGDLTYRKHLYIVNTKAYVFIEKLREIFTNETIDYILAIENGQQIQLKYATLEEILPALRIGRERKAAGGGTKIQIVNAKSVVSELKDAEIKTKKIEEEISTFYYTLTKKIQYYNGQTKIRSGYAIEAAMVAATKKASYKLLNNKELNTTDAEKLKQDLLFLYQEQTGQTPFFGGGDLSAEVAQELLKISKNIAIQIKNLSSGGASVATTSALKNVLKYLVLVLNKPISVTEIKEIITNSLFKTDSRITSILDEAIKKSTEAEIKKFENELDNLPNIILI